MELHDDPQRLVNTLVKQHSVVLGELHGDITARLAEVPDRFVDQGDDPRSITVSCTLLETVLYSRLRRQSRSSTLKAMRGNGFGVVLVDGKGTRIGVRKHPRTWSGELLESVPYVPGGEQYSLEEVLGCPLGGEGVPAPQGYRLYVLWWPGSLGLGGAVLAAGMLTDKVQVLYASTPLPAAVLENRAARIGLAAARGVPQAAEPAAPPVKRRRDQDFGDVADATDDAQGTASPQTS